MNARLIEALMKRMLTERTASDISETFVMLCAAMSIATVFAHERVGDLPKVLNTVRDISVAWLDQYEINFKQNPLVNLNAFYRRSVIMARDETEIALGVRERSQEVKR
jgi:hypothetical protein